MRRQFGQTRLALSNRAPEFGDRRERTAKIRLHEKEHQRIFINTPSHCPSLLQRRLDCLPPETMGDYWRTSGRSRLKARAQNGMGARAERRAAVARADFLYEAPPAPCTTKNHPRRPRRASEGDLFINVSLKFT